MEDKKEQPPITDQLKDYLETYIELAKLRAIDRSTSIIAGMVTDMFIVLGLALTMLFVSITIAFYFAHLLGSYWQGFGLVALLYLIIIALVYIFRKSLERPIVNVLLRKFFK
jgi:hypothetical protein